MTRIAIYTRLSHDPDGTKTATARQEQDCRLFARLRGWEVAEVFEDVDVSAYKRGVTRPAYERLLFQIEERAVDVILVWKLDRLVRRSAEFERFWAACEHAGVALASVTEPIDSSTELGLAIVRILVTFAALESATKSVRLQAAYRAAALRGEHHAVRRPYGLTTDWSAIVPEEAALIREAAERVLSGETVAAVVRDWHARGLPSPRGSRWTVHSLRDLLCNPRVAGLRTYRGEIIARGDWPPILDEATAARLRLWFADPSRRRAIDVTARPHLLIGFLRCARCGSRLRVQPHSRDRVPYYHCAARPSGCNGVAICRDRLDELVSFHALRRIEQLRGRAQWWAARGSDDPALAGTLERYRRDLEQAGRDYYIEHLIDRTQFLDIRDRLDRALAQERRDEVPLRVHRLLRRLNGRSPMVAWPELDMAERRAILSVVLDHVVVHAAPRATGRFHPERVEIRWVGQGVTHPGHTRFLEPPRHRLSPDTVHTTGTAAAYLGLNPQWVLRLIRRDKLAATRGPRGWTITQAALDRFLDERRLAPRPLDRTTR